MENDATVPRDTQDHWLDKVTSTGDHQRRTVRSHMWSTFAVPARWLRRVSSYLATTPGKLLSIALILSLAILAAGYSMSESSAQRQNELDELLSNTEPMSYSAHNLYTSLSLADTIATTGFVQGGVESAGTRARYNSAIDRAMISATESAAGVSFTDQSSLQLISDIERQIPIYTGLIETARANSRIGNPVGGAYMSQASALMREDILPPAAELFDRTSSDVREQQSRLTRPQWVPLSGLFAAVFFLLISQWALWNLTRRRLNQGMLTATALMTIAILWVSASNFSAWQAGTRGFEEASMPWDSLTASRIEAQQARTAETLALVRRQSVSDSADLFDSTTRRVAIALNDYEKAGERLSNGSNTAAQNQALIVDAREALEDWTLAHDHFSEALVNGNYLEAVRLATITTAAPGAPPTAAGSYDRLDVSLSRLIADARSTMRSYIRDGLAATELVSAAVLILSILAVAAVWIGMRPRLQEYL